ncbi:hypothetical protein [Robiginitalea aurantiaca]|uniref:Membrane metalloprotease n=1 Tax=Robiginitalea aurantiaca TaxID=3056915 RepID=A0ABT7WDM5_9FLAO|nr:hypothetical protein [Robiginitalea aurantiaca]MDM9631019.1 hypothetical protein [Robiginitalea aurantiaca]
MLKRFFALLVLSGLLMPSACTDDSDISGGDTDRVDRSANLLSAGASGSDILTNEDFDRIQIEVAYVNGFRPTDLALDNLSQYLQERTFKEDISYLFLPLPSPDENDLTLQEIATLETENRTTYNDGRTLSVYIYFADAPSVNDDESEGLVTLGAVYRNTSMVIHESTIRSLASKSVLITVAEVESTALIHEFGHLFGLVDLGTPEVNPHEDPEASNHCDVEGCLMRAELEFGTGVLSVLEKRAAKGLSELPGLDAECIRDLQAIGGR